MKYLITLLYLALSLTNSAHAKQAFLVEKCDSAFPEAMMFVQEQLKKRGYKISRIQHVDKGLQSRGYDTLRYRVVFFGRPEEIELIKSEHAFLIPFFPLNITVYEKEEYTGISAIDPLAIQQLYSQGVLEAHFKQWSHDVHEIVQAFKNCDN